MSTGVFWARNENGPEFKSVYQVDAFAIAIYSYPYYNWGCFISS